MNKYPRHIRVDRTWSSINVNRNWKHIKLIEIVNISLLINIQTYQVDRYPTHIKLIDIQHISS